ncbi:MAG: tyrosine-type recombinase/integrase [Alistipes sp.]
MITFTITNKQRPKATIIMLISLHGKQYKKSIGAGVPVKYWNDKKKRAKVTADFDGNYINDKIELWYEIGKKAITYFNSFKTPPAQDEFVNYMARFTAEGDEIPLCENKYFCDYFEFTYIPRYKCVRSSDTVVKYTTALHKLREFERKRKCKLRFEDVNIDFYNHFQAWFYSNMYSANYFGNIIKIIKQVFRESRMYDKIHACDGTEHKDFIAPSQTADAVYLDEEELERIYSMKLSPALLQGDQENMLTPDNMQKKIVALERARGLFLIGCYTGLRVSDFSRLNDAHIGKYITIKTVKTGASVVIPIHPIVKSIMQRGFDLSNTISDQKLNEQIKELCRLAGITSTVMVNKNRGGKNSEITLEKYKLISSHTARRSFATNAYKAGVPTIAIMKITGHTKESTFLKYIKVSAEENADILSTHPFFMNTGKAT